MRGTCKLSRPRSQIGNEVLAEIEIASEERLTVKARVIDRREQELEELS